jgi:hypothetical protein
MSCNLALNNTNVSVLGNSIKTNTSSLTPPGLVGFYFVGYAEINQLISQESLLTNTGTTMLNTDMFTKLSPYLQQVPQE